MIDAAVRELIRKNLGRATPPARLHPPQTGAVGLVIGPTRDQPGVPTPTPEPLPAVPTWAGHSYALTLRTVGSAREVTATPRIGYPYQIRRITLTGNVAITEAVSLRLLVSEDNDTSAVTDPTGSDIILPLGDLVSAEDPGLHVHLTSGPMTLEPWTLVTLPSSFLKLKWHNTLAATERLLTALIDIDELPR
jgi:hypothetical protein